MNQPSAQAIQLSGRFQAIFAYRVGHNERVAELDQERIPFGQNPPAVP
jgi:hypothetical protein